MKRSRGSAGVALGSVAIASSLVTMRAQRAFTSVYADTSCCKDGWFIESLLETGDRLSAQQKSAHTKTRRKAVLSSVLNVRQVVDETDQK